MFLNFELIFKFQPLVDIRSSAHPNKSEDEYSSGKEGEQDTLLSELEERTTLGNKKGMHPFVRMMLAFWPFGEVFKTLRIWGKVYEMIKVCVWQ